MNNSTLTSQNTSVSHVFNVTLIIDHVFRYMTIFVHLVFIFVLIMSSSLRKKTKLYVNHATIVNCFYTLVMTMYIFFERPNTSNPILNDFICSISEIWWIYSSYIRMYSIFLIAIYRYLAVFKVNLFKKINDSYLMLLSPIIFIWFISILFPVIFKYIFRTNASRVFCLDGDTTVFTNTILYFIFNYSLIVIIPSFFIVGIYIKIIHKLKMNSKRIIRKSNSLKTISVNLKQSSSQETEETQNNRKQRRFANQFILMCVSVIASAFVLSIFSLRGIIPNYFIIFFYWRPPLRIYLNCSIMIVPLISLYYHPNRGQFFNKVFSA
ncbi:unnamed protein product [Brachionus calyciflorus]|uniref:G-protein coupled receptors family 1 profile domain-containing protein n=1 Tax=Brachionus calyciflorus TaxID=104777 RepID=A0A814HLT2_9BILA|nr:unnamed protein product [Brachionus calyciflorus]